jgi:hypothetical protein
MLKSDFVLGWRNIVNEDYVGRSFGYSPRQTSVGTTNGAGPHNVQIFMLSPELVVLHALPGFWHPKDLARELRFAQVLFRLWQSKNHSWVQKRKIYRRLQLAEARYHPEETYARSGWQSFDEQTERARLVGSSRDTFQSSKGGYLLADMRGNLMLKPINVLVHERMAKIGFTWFDDFDIAAFVDYGTRFYDNNRGIDRTHTRFDYPRQDKGKSKDRNSRKITQLQRSMRKKPRRKPAD